MPGCGRRLAYLIRTFDLGYYVSFVSPLIFVTSVFVSFLLCLYIYLSDSMCILLDPGVIILGVSLNQWGQFLFVFI